MAAAFAALVSLQNNLHLIQNHPRHSFSFEHKQIESLRASVDFLIQFMETYHYSKGIGKEAAEALEMRIARAAEAAEDVLESHVVDQILCGKTRTSNTKPSRFLLDLQKVIQRMDYMRRKAIKIKAQSTGAKSEQLTYSTAAAATPSTPPTLTKKNSMVGFDDVLLQLLDQLTGVPPSLRVIPIVGMGGIGKTTLATNAFRHQLIVQHFDVCLWATISQKIRVDKILKQLLSINESTSESVAELGLRLHKSLYGRRYLIILDDMWSLEAWDDVKFFFPNTNNGSRIVVTTRHWDVANHLGISSLEIDFLDKENSWDLFCQNTFVDRVCPSELEQIGKKIVEKCKGLPLTIVVVGGHLRNSSMTREYWANVAKHMNSILDSTENEHCLNVLSLSYSYLPAHLKPCFVSIGAFPEDEVIYVWEVLNLWMGEGFIQPSESSRLEVVAEQYLEELSERNLILVDTMGYNEEIEYFKLHDLLRELCLKISKKEEFLHVLDIPQAINRERRVAINGRFQEIDHQTRDAPLRCLRSEGGPPSNNFKLLRVLNDIDSTSTNQSIFEQVNLRYLSVVLDYKTRRTLYLPSSISMLWNLQMLVITIVNQSSVITPYEIWEMLQLRQLVIDPISLLDPLPTDQENDDLVLRNLETLSKVENFRLSDEVCKRIPRVRELQLSYFDEASSYYCPNNLGKFHELEYLVCQFDGNSTWHDFALSFVFPSSLLWIYLSGCRLHWEELTTMVGSLPNLLSLQLYPNSVVGSEWTPVEGQFLHLKNLDICGCDDLVHLNADSSHFPVLEHFHLRHLSKLDEFPSSIGEIPTLRRIQLDFCSLSSTISAMRALVEQEEELGNEGVELDVSFRGDDETLDKLNTKLREEGLRSKNLSLFLQNVKSKSAHFE